MSQDVTIDKARVPIVVQLSKPHIIPEDVTAIESLLRPTSYPFSEDILAVAVVTIQFVDSQAGDVGSP